MKILFIAALIIGIINVLIRVFEKYKNYDLYN